MRIDLENTTPGAARYGMVVLEYDKLTDQELLRMAGSVPIEMVDTQEFAAVVDLLVQRRLMGHSDTKEDALRSVGGRFGTELFMSMGITRGGNA